MARSANGIALRPHAKTHKSPRIARLQLDYGAVGLTVATLAEAEMFASTGAAVFIAYPFWAGGEKRRARIDRLRERTDLRVGVDSVAAAEQLPKGQQVLIEVVLTMTYSNSDGTVDIDFSKGDFEILCPLASVSVLS